MVQSGRPREVGSASFLGGLHVVSAVAPFSSGDHAVSPQAGAAETPVISETFTGANVATPSSWVEPTAPKAYTNGACLTAGTATGQSTAADPRLCKPRCGLSGRGRLTSDRNPTQPSGRGHDEVERPGLERPRRHLRELSMGRRQRGRARLRPGRRESLESGGASGHRTAGRRPRLRLGACRRRPGSGLRVPRGRSRRLRERFQPPRGRLGLYRSLVGNGPDPPSGRRAGPGQRGRRLLRPEQLGRRRRFPGAPWEHSGRIRGACRGGHQHHEQPGQHDRQRLHRCQRPQRGLRSGLEADRRLTGELHRRAADRGERRRCEWPVPQRLGEPFNRRPLSVGLRLDRVDRLRRRQQRDLERRREHPAAGARR